MICTKCGAPIPAGMEKCPYCGATNKAAGPGPMAGDETVFAGGRETEFAGQSFGKTEFAPRPGKTVDNGEDRTELAGSWPEAAPLKQPRRTKEPKRVKAGHKVKQAAKKKAGKTGHNNLLRFALLGILVVLIILLLLR